MRKSLFAALLLASASLGAQTVNNPLPLEIGGDNTYSFSGSYSTPVFRYTAPEDQIVTLVASPSNSTMSVTHTGAYNNKVPQVASGNTNTFIIEKGKYAYVTVTAYASPVKIEASAHAYPYNLAADPAQALVIETGAAPLFVPFREENYTEVPVYLTYDATEDGALELTFSGYVHNAYFAEGPDGEYTGISCKTTDYTTYRTGFEVKSGKQYYLKISSTSAKFLTAELTHPVYGESPDYPFLITGTTATVPAKAGKYYYEVTGTETGYCVISSDVTDFDGTVSFGQRIESNVVTVDDGTFDIRQRATTGGHYYIIVDKKSSTDEPQSFSVIFQKPQPYDSEYEGEPVVFGQETPIPPYEGTYYYRISVPEGAYLLDISLKNPLTDSYSDLRLYRANNTSVTLFRGDPDIVCEADPGGEYILMVKVTEPDKRNALMVKLTELGQGEGAGNPFTAVIGENALPAGPQKYYLYDAEVSSKVVITPADMSINYPSVQRLKSDTYPSQTTVTLLKEEDHYIFEAERGEKYLIRFTKIQEDTTFELSIIEYGQGESKDDPFIAEGDTLEIPASPSTYWWSYVPARTGKLRITTDLDYDIVSSPTRENAVSLLDPVTGAVIGSMPVDYGTDKFNPLIVNVVEGKEYLIRVVSVSVQEGKTLSLEINDLDPGEIPAVAIEITPDAVPYEYTFDKNSSGFASSKWYAIELVEGELSIYSTQSLTFRIYLANDDDNYTTSNYTFAASSFWSDDYSVHYYGIRNVSVTRPGRYYLASYYNYSDVTATIEGSAVKTGVVGIDDITADEADAMPEYYDLSGRRVTRPSAGIYIVKQGDKVSKVIFK